MSEQNVAELVLEIHAAMIADQPVTKKPSPWLGELYRHFQHVAKAKGIETVPDRYAVMAHLLRNARSFRVSGDWSDDFQTVWFNPTEIDRKHMERLENSKNAVLETASIDKNQLHLFENFSERPADGND